MLFGFFFFQAEDGIRDYKVTGVQTCALPILVPPLAIAALSGRTPWEAWSALASRPALVFRERSAWVTEGEVLLVPTTLVFSEPHRITALGEAVFRVRLAEDERRRHQQQDRKSTRLNSSH